tara:strand:- start:1783 stop:2298 length:516 start_codon:yes stop_codon:yes gene_type:complete
MNWDNDKNQSWNQTSWNQNQGEAPRQNQGASIWDNFETIETSPQRNAYVPANIDSNVKIVELKTIYSIKNNNRPVFVATIELQNSKTDETQVTQRFDWVAKADERPYLQNIKALICAINPEGDPRSFGRDLMEAITGPEQPAFGKVVHLRSEQILTRNGNEFTKCHWSPAR